MDLLIDRAVPAAGLRRLASAIETPDAPESILGGAARILSEIWPAKVRVSTRILFDREEYLSTDFRPAGRRQAGDLCVDGESRGSLELFFDSDGQTPEARELSPFIESCALLIAQALKGVEQRRHLQERVERLENGLEGARDGLWNWNPASGEIFVDDTLLAMLGYSRGELEPTIDTWQALVHADDLEQARTAWQEHQAGRTRLFACEHRVRARNGDWRWVLSRGQLMKHDADGESLQASGTCVDVHERKVLELSMQAFNRELTLINRCQQAVNKNGDLESVLGTLCHLLREQGDYPLVWIGRVEPGAPQRLRLSAWSASLGEPGEFVFAIPGRATGGGSIARAMRGETVAVVRDIASDPDAESWRDLAERCSLVSSITLPLRDGQEIVGILGVFSNRRDSFEEAEQGLLARVAEELAFALQTLVAQEAAEKAGDELRRSLDETELLVNAMTSILVGVGPDDNIRKWNHAAERIFGTDAESVVGRPLLECSVDWDWPAVLRLIGETRQDSESSRQAEIAFTKQDGGQGLLGLRCTKVAVGGDGGLLLVGDDITEQLQRQNRRLHSRKLESLGQMAAGIAHEINTPLQYVSDNTSFCADAVADLSLSRERLHALLAVEDQDPAAKLAALREVIEDEDIAYLLNELPPAVSQTMEGVKRVSKIVRSLRLFMREDKKNHTLSSLREIVEATVTLCRNEWRYVAGVELNLDPELPSLPCAAAELSQALLNIIVNAAQALSEGVDPASGERGSIRISSSLDGDCALLCISDNGPGVPFELQERIFEPFFTTKTVGSGTGQGLSLAREIIVGMHGGEISLVSEPDAGCSFRIRLPLAEEL